MRMTGRTPLRPFTVVVAAVCIAGCGLGGTAAAGEVRVAAPRLTVSTADARAGAASVNAFGFDLLRPDLSTTKGNIVVSPWGIAEVLGMARAGASGSTATEMAQVLHAPDGGAFDRSVAGIDAQLASRNGTFDAGGKKRHVELSTANRAFVQKDLALAHPYLRTLASAYGSGIGVVDYQGSSGAAKDQINAWVRGRTHGRIAKLVESLNDRTRLILVNAAYLKADWATPFSKERTTKDPFSAPDGAVSVPFMHDSEQRRYAAGDGWQAVELAYAGDKLAMDVIVPDAGRYNDVVRSISPAVLDNLTNSPPVEVELALPKWDFESKLGLRARLSDLGMPTAFHENAANFSGITTQDRLFVSDVIHQANITVDEKGTVAAAATAAVFESVGASIDMKRLDVDRPFVFVVRDLPSGAIVFAGQVTNPSK